MREDRSRKKVGQPKRRVL